MTSSRDHDESVETLLGDLRSVLRGRGHTSPLEALAMVTDLRALLLRLEAEAVSAAVMRA